MRSLVTAATAQRSLAAYVAFFLSGASSLIFQTIWTRMLHHVFGATSVAISTVLTVFMAGLGLGAWLGGRYANRIRHPIITYAIAEIGVGVWGLLVPLLVRNDGWLATVNSFLRAELGADSGMFMVARFLCVAPILIIPTTLMGSTLPLLTRHFVGAQQDARAAGAKVGVLYALNTFGAATGPLLSAFVLMPSVGLAVTNVVACSMNFTLAAMILLARRSLLEGRWTPGERLRFWPEKTEIPAPVAPVPDAAALGDPALSPEDASVDEPLSAIEAEPPPVDAPKKKASGRKKAAPVPSAPKRAKPRKLASAIGTEAPIPELARKIAFLCFAGSGAAALAYEVVWSRALAMTIGSSIYSFALILETFLIGIAGGAAAMSAFLGGRARPYVGLCVTSVALIVLANVPWAIDIVDPANPETRFSGGWDSFALLSTLYAGPVVLAAIWAHRKIAAGAASAADQFRDTLDWRPLVVVLMAAMPLIAAGVNTLRFPGYLPKIILSVVAAVSILLVLAALMNRAPTLLLAIVQLFIAGATLVSYIWQDEIPRAFAQLVVSIPQDALPDHVGTVKVFMFLTVVLCTLPATLGMGAMFPLTVRIWTAGGEKIAADVASVYAGNTVGSILGAWLPGFILFALIGSERTLHLGIALNMVLALVMLIAGVADPDEDRDFWSWRRLAAIGLPGVAAIALAAASTVVDFGDWRWWTRAGAAVGFGALAVIEFTWLKASASGAPRESAAGWALVLVPLVAGAALAAVMVSPSETDPWALRAIYTALRVLVAGVAASVAWANWRAMKPPRAAAPGLVPVTYRESAREPVEEPRPTRDLPTWHAVTVYILAPLIPALLALLWMGTRHNDSWLRWNRSHMTLGVFRLSYAHDMLDESTWGEPDLVYYNDGLTTTVSVERWGRHYAMKNNGKVDASNGDDMPTQINVAVYPLMMHPRGPRDLDVAVIGFGSGVTVGTAMRFPLRRLDVIELEGSIIDAARFFEDVNHLDYVLPHWPYVQMDRLSIINDDGRNYLASTQQQYDVIISEPSNPWITGVSDLFTVDHWRITKQRLRPGGIYCQWVQLYELSPENIKTIYRTFASQFAHVVVLSADDRSSDTVMLGSDTPVELDLSRIRTAYQLPGIAEEMERGNVFSPYDLFARTLLANRDEVMRYTHIEHRRRGTEWEADAASTNAGPCAAPQCRREPAVLNTDDNARIEFAAPNDLIGFSRYEGYLRTIYSERWPYGMPRPPERGDPGTDGRLRGFGAGDEASRNFAELALSMIAHGRYGWAGDMIERSQRVGRSRETTVALEVLTHLLTTDNEPSVRIEPPVPGPEMDRRTADQLVDGFDSVREAVDQQAYGAALVAMENIPAPLRLHSGPGMRLLYGYLLYKAADGSAGHYRTAVEHLEDLVRTEEDYVLRHPEAYYFLARSHDANEDYAAALRAMRAYVEARLVPIDNDPVEVPEPAADQAPASDAPGEADKLEHSDRG